MNDSQKIRIDQINIGARFREDMGDLAELGRRIKARKVVNPIWVKKTKSGFKLLGGERRLRTMRDVLGESMIPAYILEPKSELEELLLERDENFYKEPNPIEQAKLGKRIEELIGNRQGKKDCPALPAEMPEVNGEPLPVKRPEVNGKETREIAAELAGFDSAATYRRAKHIAEDGTPELQAAVTDGTLSVTDAASVASKPPEVQQAAVAAVKAGKAPTARAAAAVVMPKNGQPYFDDEIIKALIGKLIRAIDQRGGIHGKFAEYKKCVKLMEDLTNEWTAWRKAK